MQHTGLLLLQHGVDSAGIVPWEMRTKPDWSTTPANAATTAVVHNTVLLSAGLGRQVRTYPFIFGYGHDVENIVV